MRLVSTMYNETSHIPGRYSGTRDGSKSKNNQLSGFFVLSEQS